MVKLKQILAQKNETEVKTDKAYQNWQMLRRKKIFIRMLGFMDQETV
jgi:hypothetical protein